MRRASTRSADSMCQPHNAVRTGLTRTTNLCHPQRAIRRGLEMIRSFAGEKVPKPFRQALGACALLISAQCWAQTAVLDVAVLRDDGTAAAARDVEVKSAASGFSHHAATGEQGRARFEAIPTGADYSIAVDGVVLAVSVPLRANEAKSVSVTLLETVVVSAQRRAPAINGLDAEVSAGFSARDLAALPVEARDLNQALVRLPNVAPSTGFFPEAPSVSINGANGLYAQYLIDGVDNNENFLGGPKFPISTGFVQDVTVLTNAYSVEYGRTGNGVVNVTSRLGTNTWTGEAFFLTRPGRSLDASSSYPGRDLSGNQVKDGFRREQGGLSMGGPLAADRTFIFANVEYTRDQKDNVLSSPALGIATAVRGHNRTVLGSIRLDHSIDDSWRVTLRVNRGEVSVQRQGGGLDGGVTFPSAGSTQDRTSTLVAAAAIYSGASLTSSTTVNFATFGWNYARSAVDPGPQVTVELPDGLTAAVLGNPGFVFDDFERSAQLQQKFTWSLGRHALKTGVDLLYSDFNLTGGGNPSGNYTVLLTPTELAQVRALNRGNSLSVTDIPATAEVTSYSVEIQPKRFGQPQRQLGWYAQDQVSLTNAVTLTAGLRWDYDSLTKAGADRGDLGNFAPRFALNWRANQRVAVRGGAGLYYDRIPYTVLSDALQQNTTSAAYRSQLQQLVAKGILPAGTALDRITYDGNLSVSPACPLGYLKCPTAETVANLRDSASLDEARILNPSGLKSPYTIQWSTGLQWQISDALVGSADAVLALGRHQLRLRDLNAPTPFTPNLANLTATNIAALREIADPVLRQAAATALALVRSQATADATRPVAVLPGGARQIIVSESQGKSRYRALNLRLSKARSADRYGYLLSYTLSKLENDTDDLNFRASNANAFSVEWGPSVNDRRHVISTVFFFYPIDALTLSVAGLFQSGQPINFIPDATIFGTTDIYGDGRSFSDSYLGNAARAPGVSRNSGRLPWAKTVDLGIRYAPRIGSAHLEWSADVFNVFNETNLSGYANAATQSNQIQRYGQPFAQRNAGPPRQFQMGLRYWF